MSERPCAIRLMIPIITVSVIALTACETSMSKIQMPDSALGFSSERLRSHVEILASDDMEGRGAGYRGERLAAEYIARRFMEIGLEPINPDADGWQAYLQSFQMDVLDGPVPWEVLESQNVAGVLAGTHPEEGYIVIGGHYDGQGMTGQADLGRTISEGDDSYDVAEGDIIWNSAVDNAVSISTIIEIARNLRQSSIRSRRSIIFAAFGAEESALNGSIHFANSPPVDISNIGAMINLEKLVGDPDAEFLYTSYGTSSVFPVAKDKVERKTGIGVTPFYPGIIANTDHYAFTLRHIPAITIGTGSYRNVHTPSDHADRLDYDLLALRTKFVASYLAEIASFDLEFEFTGDINGHLGASGGPATVAEQQAVGFDGDNSFKVTALVKNSPADKAGIRVGDLVIGANGNPLPSKTFYTGLENIFGEETHCEQLELLVNRRGMISTVIIPESCS